MNCLCNAPGPDNLAFRTNNGFIQAFVCDPLNQLTNVSRSGPFTVAGATTAAATSVTVNASNAVTSAAAQQFFMMRSQ
jgi:hypothetical protein